MAKVVRVRDVPDLAYRKLRARAAQSGMSLSEYARSLRASPPFPTLTRYALDSASYHRSRRANDRRP